MPKIGLLSDSHGHAAITASAARLLVESGAELLLHLGDVGTDAVLDALVTSVPGRVVFGNTDFERESLGRHATAVGLSNDDPIGTIDVGGGRELMFLHGDDTAATTRALRRGVAYLCHGHTHRRRDERRGATRIINPGALCRASVYTVALLDTDRDELRSIEVR